MSQNLLVFRYVQEICSLYMPVHDDVSRVLSLFMGFADIPDVVVFTPCADSSNERWKFIALL